MTNDLKEIYDDTYVSKYHQKPGLRYKNILSEINIKSDDKILDIGCGNGLLFGEIMQKVRYCDGVDFSDDFIQVCKTKFPDFKNNFHCDDVIRFCSGKKQYYTKAFMLDFTEHVYDSELLQIFMAAKNVLTNDGELILHTPNGMYFPEILKKIGILKQLKGHVAIRNGEQYKILLNSAGFKNIKIIYLSHYNFLRYFDFLKFIPFVGKFFKARLLIIAKK
jgi:2-polyprenyl-6-hydroxyphenyl methylase / 3-demethylubiquinone-9 3-methyltransferase